MLLNRPTRRFFLVILPAFFALLYMAFWAGIPKTIPPLLFWAGAIIVAGSVSILLTALWHLLLRPLPPKHRFPELELMSMTYRRSQATLLAIAGLCLTVGGFWDEVWHRQYGLPFGVDFFWRPHMLMYISIFLMCVLALWGGYRIVAFGHGTWQQRFRANPILGLTTLLGMYLMFCLPADPIWHWIYGEDLTAWSIPHLVLGVSFSGMMLLAGAIQLSTMPSREWRSLRYIQREDFVVLVAYLSMTLFAVQVVSTDWDTSAGFVRSRPEWLLPIVLVGMGGFLSVMTAHSTRRLGMATLLMALAASFRWSLIQIFGYTALGVRAWLCLLPVALSVDLTVWLCRRYGRFPNLVWTSLGVIASLCFGVVPMVHAQFSWPIIDGVDWVAVLFFGGLISVYSSWVGIRMGDYIGTRYKQVDEIPTQLQFLPPVALGSAIVLMLIFIVTASAPV